jgi:hypothetical protein
MNRVVKIIGIGIISAQAVFWGTKLAKASAVEDGGTAIATSALCHIETPKYAFEINLQRAMSETGIMQRESIMILMTASAKGIAEVVITKNIIAPWCAEMRKFYIERGLYQETGQ